MNLVERLTQYASYHRDRRNIATHFVGIPMIVLSVATLLSRPAFVVGGAVVSPALVVIALALVYYVRLDARFGLAMALPLGLAAWVGAQLAAGSTFVWLGIGLGLSVVGWPIQLVGHAFEGRKPAFVDDLVGLLVGPLFIVAEVAFFLGLRREVAGAVIANAGPTRVGRVTAVA